MATEKRLIDANHIVAVAEHAYNEWNLAMAAADGQRQINQVYKMEELCKAVKAVADAAPTVDAVEVVHGKWLQRIDNETEMHECSVCGARVVKGFYEYENPNLYCYHCGAKMDGERSPNA